MGMTASLVGGIVGGVALVTCVALPIVCYKKTARGAYEETPFTLLHKEGNFEIRDYPSMRIVETNSPEVQD